MFMLTFLSKINPACRNDANEKQTGSHSKMTDAEYSKIVCLGVKIIYVGCMKYLHNNITGTFSVPGKNVICV